MRRAVVLPLAVAAAALAATVLRAEAQPALPFEVPGARIPGQPLRPVLAATSTELAMRAVGGAGMYVWRWERAGPVAQVVARAREAGLDFLVVRASSQSQGLYLAPVLAELLPLAHQAGIKVVAYDPPRFEDPAGDVRRAAELMAFRAAGHGIDAFAADIEPRWELATAENVDLYGRLLREVAGPTFPLVGIVYPPNQFPRFPYEAAARWFDVLSPMSYWRAKTTDAAGFVGDSVAALRALGRPVSVIGQAFSYDSHAQPQLRGHPPRPEVEAAIAAAHRAGAIGMAFWVWELAEPWVLEVVGSARWLQPAGPGAGEADGAVAPPVHQRPDAPPRPLAAAMPAGPPPAPPAASPPAAAAQRSAVAQVLAVVAALAAVSCARAPQFLVSAAAAVPRWAAAAVDAAWRAAAPLLAAGCPPAGRPVVRWPAGAGGRSARRRACRPQRRARAA